MVVFRTMSSTGGSHTAPQRPAYDTFVDGMLESLKKNFHARTPVNTARSRGLNSQAGLIVGAVPDTTQLYDLLEALKGIGTGWSVYPENALHCTFGSFEDPDARRVTEPLHTDFRLIQDAVREFADNSVRYNTPALQDVKLLVSRDTLVLAATPNYPLFLLREAVLNAAWPINNAIGEGSWGTHITLARAKRPLTDEERGLTDNMLATLMQPPTGSELPRLPRRLALSNLLIGAFVVREEAFGFSDLHRTIVPVPC